MKLINQNRTIRREGKHKNGGPDETTQHTKTTQQQTNTKHNRTCVCNNNYNKQALRRQENCIYRHTTDKG